MFHSDEYPDHLELSLTDGPGQLFEPLADQATDAYFVRTDSATMDQTVYEHVMTHELGH